MDREEARKRLKDWQNYLRTLEDYKRKQIIERLERQILEKQKKLEEKRKEYAQTEYKQQLVNEKLEKMLREERKELEIERLKHFVSTE